METVLLLAGTYTGYSVFWVDGWRKGLENEIYSHMGMPWAFILSWETAHKASFTSWHYNSGKNVHWGRFAVRLEGWRLGVGIEKFDAGF
jgi:hypothetical protein